MPLPRVRPPFALAQGALPPLVPRRTCQVPVISSPSTTGTVSLLPSISDSRWLCAFSGSCLAHASQPPGQPCVRGARRRLRKPLRKLRRGARRGAEHAGAAAARRRGQLSGISPLPCVARRQPARERRPGQPGIVAPKLLAFSFAHLGGLPQVEVVVKVRVSGRREAREELPDVVQQARLVLVDAHRGGRVPGAGPGQGGAGGEGGGLGARGSGVWVAQTVYVRACRQVSKAGAPAATRHPPAHLDSTLTVPSRMRARLSSSRSC